MNDPERDPWPSVTCDDRCPWCPAGDGEDCTPECCCPSCDLKREQWARLMDLELADLL